MRVIGQTITLITLATACALASFAQAQPGGPGNGALVPLGDAPEPNENPITESKRVLGKILFWDEQLSSDNTVACGTCHKPASGGADDRLETHPGFDRLYGTADDVIGSPGIRALDSNGMQLNDPLFGHGPQVTGRATPSFFTSMFADSNFWDGRASDEFIDPITEEVVIDNGGSLESQALGPILSTVEMAQLDRDWDDVVAKLAQVSPMALATNLTDDMNDALQGGQAYGDLFRSAFGDDEITPVRIAFAIASYERTLVPNETPWDAYIAGDNNAMTADQIAGWNSFNNNTPCGNCHTPPLFSDDNFRNIGLRPSLEDLGQFEVTGQNNDRGDFKTPSLRNVGLRGALMHVGWVTDVADSIDFYNAGTNNTGHTQFTADQSGIPQTNTDIDEIDVFGDDPVRRGQVVEFLNNGLTDPRAANEVFPFDRPVLASERFEQTIESERITAVSADNTGTETQFSASIVSENGSRSGNLFTADETLSINIALNIDSADRGQAADFYCVVIYDGQTFALQANGSYLPWDGSAASLSPSRSTAALSGIENVAVAQGLTGISGSFRIHVGYRTATSEIRYNEEAITFSVE